MAKLKFQQPLLQSSVPHDKLIGCHFTDFIYTLAEIIN